MRRQNKVPTGNQGADAFGLKAQIVHLEPEFADPLGRRLAVVAEFAALVEVRQLIQWRWSVRREEVGRQLRRARLRRLRRGIIAIVNVANGTANAMRVAPQPALTLAQILRHTRVSEVIVID